MTATKFVRWIVAFSAWRCISVVHAARASPKTWDSPIGPVKLVGNEEHHMYVEVATGYPIVPTPPGQDSESPFAYAVTDGQGKLVASEYLVKPGVNPDDVADLQADVRPHNARASRRHQSRRLQSNDDGYPLSLPLASKNGTTLTIQNFVLRIRFADHVNHTLPDSAAYDKLMNGQFVHGSCDAADESCSAPTGSVTDYFREQSYGKLAVNSTVSEWVDLPHNQAYYAAGCSGSCDAAVVLLDGIMAALKELDDEGAYNWLDFDTIGSGQDGLSPNGYVDLFTVVTSGYGAENAGPDQHGNSVADRIWSHMWYLNNYDLWSAPAFTTNNGVSFNTYTINP
jgi:hypothetical protein